MKKSSRFIFIFGAIVLLLGSIYIIYAVFQEKKEALIQFETEEAKVEVFVEFDGIAVSKDSPYYDQIKKALLINASNENEGNYIGKLNISIEVTPYIVSRLRIKIQDEWHLRRTYSNTTPTRIIDEIISHEHEQANPTSLNYLFHLPELAAFKSDYGIDHKGYLYYRDLLQKGETYRIEIIDGGKKVTVKNTNIYYEESYLYLDLLIDLVQANRFSEVWEMDADFYE